jgi:hypothetical protein
MVRRTLAVRLHVVRMIEVEILDLGGCDKLADLENLGRGNSGLVEVLVGQDDDVLALGVLVALDDVGPRDLYVLFLAEALLDDPTAVLLVQGD